jgi:hypothetical protein
MKTIGIIATALVGALAAVGAFVAVKSIPDVQRYLKIRSM